MKQTISSSRLLALLGILIFLFSCRYKVKDGPQWESEFTAPLLNSSVSLKDVLSDTSLFLENADKSITFVVHDTLIDFVLSEFLSVPDTSVSTDITMDSIRLPTDSITHQFTIDDFVDLPFPLFFCITSDTGIPGIDTFLTPIEIDASSFFKWAKLNSGELRFEINNNSPARIDSVDFLIRNQGITTIGDIIDFFIDSIPPFTVYSETVPVDSFYTLEIEGTLEAILNRLKIEKDTTPTLLCPEHFIEIKLILINMGASEAEAVFPDQDIVDFESDVVYDFGNGIAITHLGIKSGELKVETVTTIEDIMEFTYILPSGRKEGVPIEFLTVINPPIPPDTIAFNEASESLAGIRIDMTGNGDKWNRFSQQIVGSLVYSGECRNMNLNDTIHVSYGLNAIVPSYIEGYLGEHTFEFSDGIQFDFFNSVTGGTLNLTAPKMILTFENSIGMDGELVINSAKALNSRTGRTVDLNSEELKKGITIPGPRLPNVGQVVSYEFELNKSNSNISEFISVLPDSLEFDLDIVANKDGNPALLDNFATDKSAISAILDLEVPLQGIADNITLITDADLDLTSIGIPEEIGEGSLKLIAENWFPMDATLQVYFKDNAGLILDSLIHEGENGTIAAGMINGAGRVEEPTRSKISSFFDLYRLNTLQSGATKATVKFTLSTKPLSEHVKLYSNYQIDFKLVSDFKYTFNN